MDDDKCKMLFPYPRGVHGLLGLSNNSGNVSTEGSSSKGKKKKKERKERFAFETRSQVDILDDGYKWRKYGQKAVKNNRFPRGYYRCSHEGCDVKKQVQRLTRVNNRERERLSGVDVKMKRDEEDSDESEEDESVDENGGAACLKPSKLNHSCLSRQLEQHSRRHHYEQYHRHHHRPPIQPHLF